MPKKLLFVSILLVSTGVIFFSILFSEKSVCGQSNSNSCCPCFPSGVKESNINRNTNTEKLLNRNTGEKMSDASNYKANTANFYNPNTKIVDKKKTLSLPKVNPRIAPLLKKILEQTAEYHGNYMEYARYSGIKIGATNYYFREDNESIKSIRTEKNDSNEPEICGRYVMVESIPVDDDLTVIANGDTNLWRNFNGKWKAVLDVGDWTYREIYPLIMTKPEMQCFGYRIK